MASMALALRLAILLLSNPALWMATASRDGDDHELLSADDASPQPNKCCCAKGGKLVRTTSISEEADEVTKDNFAEDCQAKPLFEPVKGIHCGDKDTPTNEKELKKKIFPLVDKAIAEKAVPLGETLQRLNDENLQSLKDALTAYKEGMEQETKTFDEAVVSVQSEYGVLKDKNFKLTEMKEFHAAVRKLEKGIRLLEEKDFVKSVTKIKPFKGRFQSKKGESDEDPKWKCCGYDNPKAKCEMYSIPCQLAKPHIGMVQVDQKLCR
mmetsp:Transcript_15137/g.43204  ORF Transcript_15137/g.43204 Transcript_15137/m.43204 type:complete len:266 (+) Transcript_15137:54-851(+)